MKTTIKNIENNLENEVSFMGARKDTVKHTINEISKYVPDLDKCLFGTKTRREMLESLINLKGQMKKGTRSIMEIEGMILEITA